MIFRSRLAAPVVIALVASMLCAPFASAEPLPETIPTASATLAADPQPLDVALATAQPGPLRLASSFDRRSPNGLAWARATSLRLQTDPAVPAGGGWSSSSKTMAIIGTAVAASGGAMVALGSNDGTVQWDTTGYVWMGAGAVLLIIALIKR